MITPEVELGKGAILMGRVVLMVASPSSIPSSHFLLAPGGSQTFSRCTPCTAESSFATSKKLGAKSKKEE